MDMQLFLYSKFPDNPIQIIGKRIMVCVAFPYNTYIM